MNVEEQSIVYMRESLIIRVGSKKERKQYDTA